MLHSSKGLVFLLVLALGGFAFTFVKPPQASDTRQRVVQDHPAKSAIGSDTMFPVRDLDDPMVQLVKKEPPPSTCTPYGYECNLFGPCCPGLECIPASTRAFCL